MSYKAKVQELLEKTFSSNKVKHTNDGFKINCLLLRETEIEALNKVSIDSLSVEVKRSGIGLVVIITLFPEDQNAQSRR